MKLHTYIHPHNLRHSEVRWIGKRVQWVISPVQIALWTAMNTPVPNSRFSFDPVERKFNDISTY